MTKELEDRLRGDRRQLASWDLTQAADQLERYRVAISDPNAVHANMLRGDIALPSVEQIIHIYGEDALRQALELKP